MTASSAARVALTALVDLLTAGTGVPVDVDDHHHTATVRPGGTRLVVRPLTLDRVGRSQRQGPVLDLALLVQVRSEGPQALEAVEAALVALERSPWSAGVAGDGPRRRDLPDGWPVAELSLAVRLPVAVPLRDSEPATADEQAPVVDVRTMSGRPGINAPRADSSQVHRG